MRIKVIVKPNSKDNNIEKEGDTYKVSVKEPAENNKANIELTKFLTKHFKTKARIVSGLNSKRKIIELEYRNL